METLIELYDERAIENVLAADVFRPARIVYLCPDEIMRNPSHKQTLCRFFHARGWDPKVQFCAVSLYRADRILDMLLEIHRAFPDCVLDVTGGTDAALFAAGMFAMQKNVPAFTYSRKNNCFYDIRNAPFADQVPCRIAYRVEEFFRMAGGVMQPGRVDNAILMRELPTFGPFFEVYLRYRRAWPGIVSYIQRISYSPKEGEPTLHASGGYAVKGEHGGINAANPDALRDLARIGMIRQLRIEERSHVAFRFRDARCRAWLRDVGSVLELYTYKACVESGIFGDVICSAVVQWDNEKGHGSVSNEIDVVAVRGVVPLFLSCKTCEVRTEAINELAILRDRFGGKGAKAALVSAEPCNAAARHRAAQLGIAIIDIEELELSKLIHRIRTIMKVTKA